MSAPHAPPQLTKKAINDRHIPPEILEKILLNLPVKSLLRFSSASKPLNSLISGQEFVKKHRRQRIVLNHSNNPDDLSNLSSCPVSALLPDDSTVDSAAVVSPFKQPVSMKAFCDELWCVKHKVTKSLYLWNPSMRTCMKLPTPSKQFYSINIGGYDDELLFYELLNRSRPYDYVYGLGYDSVGDDYKILRFGLETLKPRVADLYSLKSDSWRAVKTFPGDVTLRFSSRSNMGLFVAGALHWVVTGDNWSNLGECTMVSFDLSTDEYGKVGFPEFDHETNVINSLVEAIAIRGKLCMSVNYFTSLRLVLWVMEDYGVVESWTKKLDIDFTVSCFEWSSTLRPFYSYDNGDILISKPCCCGESWREKDCMEIMVYRDEEKLWRKNIRSNGGCRIFSSFVYTESLVSPAIYLAMKRS